MIDGSTRLSEQAMTITRGLCPSASWVQRSCSADHSVARNRR
jgi:hypothetical protein